MFPNFTRLHSFILGVVLSTILFLFLFVKFGCSKEPQFVPATIDTVFNIPPLPEKPSVTSAPKIRVVHSANSIQDVIQDTATNVPVEATPVSSPNWYYEHLINGDTLRMSIRKADGLINTIVLKRVSFQKVEVPEPQTPQLPSLNNDAKFGSLSYHLRTTKDLFAPYWDIRAGASLSLILNTSITAEFHYAHDNNRVVGGITSPNEGRLLIGFEVKF